MVGLFLLVGIVQAFANPPPEQPPTLISILELERGLSGAKEKALSFRIEGIVRAVAPARHLLALQDASGAELLELPGILPGVSVGQSVALEANPCILTRRQFGLRLTQVPVIDNDRLHTKTEKSGTVFLGAGMQPIRLEWFNGPAEFFLNLDYEGPELPRQKIPGAILRPGGSSQNHPLPAGLHYHAYELMDMDGIPDFTSFTPVSNGVATNFSAGYRTRDQYCGLAFDGLIEISKPGDYTFYLASDDGSRLYVGEPPVSCKILPVPTRPAAPPETLEQALNDRSISHWIEAEGEVTFASEDHRDLVLQILTGGNNVPVTVIEGADLFGADLLHNWVKVDGICAFSGDAKITKLAGIFTPGASHLQRTDLKAGGKMVSAGDQPTAAAQVRRLSPAEAAKHLPAKIEGVVIYASSSAVVLSDSSGGVFVGSRTFRWARQPEVGEIWRMTGTTDPGFFSPVVIANTAKFLGFAPLPDPIQPTRDQLMNGNMDAQYGELHGVITSATRDEIALLTADGKVTVIGSGDRPLPDLPKSVPGGGSIIGSVARIRGCFATLVNLQTREVTPGKVYIYPALVQVEDPAPGNPFALPAKTPSDLMWFDARASALLRTKLTGQVIFSSPGRLFAFNGKEGFRVATKDGLTIAAGDWVEAVGFPKLGGPSPILQEAQVRKIGDAPLTKPTRVSPGRLLERKLDSTLVEVEATLVSDAVRQGERVLELQSGPWHFSARLSQHEQAATPLPAGCQLVVAGVYASADENPGTLAEYVPPFELLINRPDDLVVLKRPPWWTFQRVVIASMALCGIVGVMFVWVALLRRKVEQRTAQLRREIEQRQLLEQYHAVEKERSRVARDLHDELGAGLTEVGMLGSLANSNATPPEEKNRYLSQLTNVAHSLVASLDEIVWAVNPDYDTIGSLVSYFSLFAESFLSLAGIKCRFRVVENLPDRPLDSKMRHGIFCAFKETLNNVARHSGAGEAQIAFEIREENLIISVVDNGHGFEAGSDAPGRDGLSGLRQRMHALGGDCEIASQTGQGTRVVLRLPSSWMQHDQNSHR